MQNVRHMPQLDGLRTLAVAGVCYFHWVQNGQAGRWHLGHLGVELFFVLSGFLITGILLRARDSNRWVAIRAFYARRFLRIFPIYYAAVLIAAALDFSHARETLPFNLAYTLNFLVAWRGEWVGSVSHFWSLCVEEQFYLIWPFVVLFAPRRGLGTLFVFVILASAFSRLFVPGIVNVLPTSNGDSLVLGGLLSLLDFRAHRAAIAMLFAGLPIAIFGIAANSGPITHIGAVLCFGWLIYAASVGFPGPVGVVLSRGPLVWLGKISYGLYVIHNFAPESLSKIGGFFHVWFGDPSTPLRYYPSLIAFTVGLATLSWYSFERPINDLKQWFPYQSRRVRIQTEAAVVPE